MGAVRSPLPVKLFIGMLTPQTELFASCAEHLCGQYGPVDFESPVLPWDTTDYYQEELGNGIKRKFLFFKRPMDPGELPAIKLFTNELEQTHGVAENGVVRRRINLDPGYITEAKVILASTKDFSHRLYIGNRIYAEVTLRYQAKARSFTSHEFTFPEFRAQAYLDMFNQMRDSLRCALNK
jgi:hypothetical protein